MNIDHRSLHAIMNVDNNEVILCYILHNYWSKYVLNVLLSNKNSDANFKVVSSAVFQILKIESCHYCMILNFVPNLS